MDMKIALVTVPNVKVAEKIAKEIIDLRLAACVNIVPKIQSLYTFQGKFEKTSEALMIIKTSKAQVKKLEDEILSLHPYDTPEFAVLDTDYVNKKYAAWVLNSSCG